MKYNHHPSLSSGELHGKCKPEYGWEVRSRNCLINSLSVRECPRYAFLVMRISMIQTRIRQFEATDLSSEIYCIDADGPQEPAWMSVTDGCARNNIERFEETVRNRHLYNKFVL